MPQMVRKTVFFEELGEKLAEVQYDQVLVMGDMNGVIDVELDRSLKGKRSDGKLPESFFRLMKQENLGDVWRQRNSKVKDYTFYSSRHDTSSRIDMLLASKNLQILTRRIEILPRVYSDHNPILWRAATGSKTRRWRLNEDLLQKPEHVAFRKDESRFFFEQNWENEVKTQTVWDTYKAVMRRLLIAMNIKERKRKEQITKELQSKFKKKEGELKKKPRKKTIIREIAIIQEQIKALERKEMEWNLKKLQQKTFEGQNKPGRYLAWQLKNKKYHKYVQK